MRIRPFSIVNLLAISLATVANFRGLFSGFNLGDSGDSRWTTTIFEHWYQSLIGNVPIFGAHFYFPDPGALGFSDSFLPQGLIYSIFRLTGLGIVPSWNITNVIFCILFASALAYLAEMLFTSKAIRFGFVFIASTSLPLVQQLDHVQTFGYAPALWIVALMLRSYRYGATSSSWHIPVVVVLLPTLALAAWYGFYLLGLLIAITLIVTTVANRKLVAVAAKRIFVAAKASSKTAWAVSAILSVLLTYAFVEIYRHSFGYSRDFKLYLKYAPSPSNWIDASQGRSIWARIYDHLGLFQGHDSPEKSMGFSPTFLLLFAICFALVFRKHVTARVLGITVFATWALITVWPSGLSAYWLIWEFVPGGTSVRCAFRVNIYLFIVALGIILFVLEKWTATLSKRKLLTSAAIVAIAIDQFRIPAASWKTDEHLNAPLRNLVSVLQSSNCDAFVLGESNLSEKTSRGIRALNLEVDAIVLASLSGVPTINGYSGRTPTDYPEGIPYEAETLEKRISWAKSKGVLNICEVKLNGTITLR